VKSSVVYSVEGFRNENTGIVDQHIDPAKLRDGSVTIFAAVASIADVSSTGQDSKTLRMDLPW